MNILFLVLSYNTIKLICLVNDKTQVVCSLSCQYATEIILFGDVSIGYLIAYLQQNILWTGDIVNYY